MTNEETRNELKKFCRDNFEAIASLTEVLVKIHLERSKEADNLIRKLYASA